MLLDRGVPPPPAPKVTPPRSRRALSGMETSPRDETINLTAANEVRAADALALPVPVLHFVLIRGDIFFDLWLETFLFFFPLKKKTKQNILMEGNDATEAERKIKVDLRWRANMLTSI